MTGPYFIGVDVGGTNIKLGILDDQGRTIDKSSIRTHEERGPVDAIGRIRVGIDELLTRCGVAMADVAAVGLGTPGSQDLHRGWILDPPNLPHWRDFPIRDRLSEMCGKPCSYANDASAAAYGEFWVGRAKDVQSMVMFTLGTGVGGGIILDGKLIEGENSFGSELGHLVIDCRDDARLCVWGGGRGQLEAYASASAVVARARRLLDSGSQSSVRQRMAVAGELTAKMLFEEAQSGDPFSIEVILETARYLGAGVTSIVHALDPGTVLIGGAMTFGGHATAIGRQFLETVRNEFRQRTFDVVLNTTIDYASLGADAGFIGAAGIAHHHWHAAANQRR